MSRGGADGHLGVESLGPLRRVEREHVAATLRRALDPLHDPRRPHLLVAVAVAAAAAAAAATEISSKTSHEHKKF